MPRDRAHPVTSVSSAIGGDEHLAARAAPMLLSPPPFEQTLPSPGAPPNVLPTTYAGRPCDWLSTRMAAPPTSGPVSSQLLPKKRALTALKRPPRAKIAPPPPPSSGCPL